MASKPVKLCTKRKVSFLDLIRPERREWLAPIGPQVAFGTYGWMVENARSYSDGSSCCPIALLSGEPYLLGLSQTLPFSRKWREELYLRFHYALLFKSEYEKVLRWRFDQDINLAVTKILPIRYYAVPEHGYPESSICSEIDHLFNLAGRHFKESPNQFWPEATEIFKINLYVLGLNYWVIGIDYGTCPESSVWHLYRTNDAGETFLDFIKRKLVEIENLLMI
ncbi:MAG: hypothetical protein NTW50_01355 [Candidatus Berkelbacteria bacterium]|nr:hypothetical protein [Candidatus Berkelbacteria bacterium]